MCPQAPSYSLQVQIDENLPTESSSFTYASISEILQGCPASPPPISAFPIPTGLWGFFFRLLVSFGQFPIQGLWKASVEFQEVTAIGN